MYKEILIYSILNFIFAFGLVFGSITNDIALCIEAGIFLIASTIHIEGIRIYKELNK